MLAPQPESRGNSVRNADGPPQSPSPRSTCCGVPGVRNRGSLCHSSAMSHEAGMAGDCQCLIPWYKNRRSTDFENPEPGVRKCDSVLRLCDNFCGICEDSIFDVAKLKGNPNKNYHIYHHHHRIPSREVYDNNFLPEIYTESVNRVGNKETCLYSRLRKDNVFRDNNISSSSKTMGSISDTSVSKYYRCSETTKRNQSRNLTSHISSRLRSSVVSGLLSVLLILPLLSGGILASKLVYSRRNACK